MDIKFEGLEEVLESIEQIGDISKLEAAMGKACALVEAAAKKKAPKDTGALRRSITSKVDNTGGDIIGTVFTPLEYAPYVEFGTGLFAEESGRQTPWAYEDDEGNWHTVNGQKPQPYLRPALEENKGKIKDILKGGLDID